MSVQSSRAEALATLRRGDPWDVLIIGGGVVVLAAVGVYLYMQNQNAANATTDAAINALPENATPTTTTPAGSTTGSTTTTATTTTPTG